MKRVAIIQARLGSTRLPGKALELIGGEPMLARVVERARRAATLHEVVVATTEHHEDEAIVDMCAARGWPCARGSTDDVLDRYCQTARQYGADVVVRITSDCPFLAPEVVDQVARALQEGHKDAAADYASNTLPPRTFPRGLDVEAMTFAALERAWREDADPAWREHVTPYIYRAHGFRLRAVVNDAPNAAEAACQRWTVDTAEDLAFARAFFQGLRDCFGHDRCSWREALAVSLAHPQWQALNRHVAQKHVEQKAL